MEEKFGDQYELVYPDYYVDTLDKAFDVGELFKKAGVDMVIIDESTYVTDYFPIQVVDALPEVPLVLFVTQATDNLWDTMVNTELLGSSARKTAITEMRITETRATMKRTFLDILILNIII